MTAAADALAGIRDGLDRVETIEPGHGRLELGAFAEPDRFGGKLDYEHRISRVTSAFAEGWGGASRDPLLGEWHPDFGVGAGLRMQW